MWHKLHDHHKIAVPVVLGSIADHTVDMIREHFFLAAHEFIAHEHLLFYSLSAAATIGIMVSVVRKRKSKSTDTKGE